jgi:hypothetical protein
MKIELFKVPMDGSASFWCDHPNCKGLSSFSIEEMGYRSGRTLLRPGSTVAVIVVTSGFNTLKTFYCQDCIDLVFQEVRKSLDKSLWAFH